MPTKSVRSKWCCVWLPTRCPSATSCPTRLAGNCDGPVHRLAPSTGWPSMRQPLMKNVAVTAAQLLDIASAGGGEPGAVTEAGLRANVSVGLRYLESWLRGVGAAAIDDLMEDAATAEISRSQVWQWIHRGVVTAEGATVTRELVEHVLEDVLGSVDRWDGDRFDDAAQVFAEVALGEEFPSFLTVPAYTQFLVERE